MQFPGPVSPSLLAGPAAWSGHRRIPVGRRPSRRCGGSRCRGIGQARHPCGWAQADDGGRRSRAGGGAGAGGERRRRAAGRREHPGEQRRHRAQAQRSRVERGRGFAGGMAHGVGHQSDGGIAAEQGGHPRHAGAALWPNRQRVFIGGAHRGIPERRGLYGVEGGVAGLDPSLCQCVWPRWHNGQCRRSGPDRDAVVLAVVGRARGALQPDQPGWPFGNHGGSSRRDWLSGQRAGGFTNGAIIDVNGGAFMA